MNFVSYSQLAKDVISWAQQLDQDYDAIVGIPRSGMLVANILALHWNVKLTDLHTFVAGGYFVGGQRDLVKEVKKVLVVDDSILSGRSIAGAKKLCMGAKVKIDYGAPYVKENMKSWLHYRVMPLPRVFEWNVFNHYWLRRACVDIDGVLCRDPTTQENDDGPRYTSFLTTVAPRYRPRVEILALVTSRLERFRPQTEAWLKKWDIKYQNLIMLDLPSAKERRKQGAHIPHKVAAFKDDKYSLFIESSSRQAQGIFEATQKAVLCSDTMTMYHV